jgi:hypothetical protein
MNTGFDTEIAQGVGTTQNAVASNGDVAYWGSDYDIYWYRSGTTARLTADDDAVALNTAPATDGTKVVYRRATQPNGAVSILMNNGSQSTELAPPQGQPRGLDRRYAVNGGWTAFTKADGANVLQVWTISPAGDFQQISLFAVGSQIDALGTDGSVVFSTGPKRYLAMPGISPVEVSSSLGQVVWRDGEFIDLLGRSAFRIVP